MSDEKNSLFFRVGDTEEERKSLLNNYGNHLPPDDDGPLTVCGALPSLLLNSFSFI